MTLTIVISRRVYLAALIVASLLILFTIGSMWVSAQGLCEYVTYVPVCVDEVDGTMRVAAPEDCVEGEVGISLVHEQKLTCILSPLEERITALEERLDACKACEKKLK